MVLGTPWFMAPEQVLGQSLDHRTDIYALGATLFFLLSAEFPFDGADATEVLIRHVHDPIPAVPGATRKINRLIVRMLAKLPGDRYDTYDDLLQDIASLL